MQRLLALVGLAAAASFVAYSAMTLHETAQAITNLQWQKPYAAKAAALLVVWEALALVFAGVLWTNRQKVAAVGCVVLLVAAVGFTFRLELVNQIQGSADTIASRVQTITQAVTDKEQLEDLKKQRSMWTTKLERETLNQKDQRELRTALDRLNGNIEEIIRRQSERPAVIEVTPEAALAARLLGGDEARWRDMLSLMLIMFWPLARIIATPAAVAFYAIAFEKTEEKRIDAAFEVLKVAQSTPEVAQFIQPDPIAQISAKPAPAKEETPSLPTSPLPSPLESEDVGKDATEDGVETAIEKPDRRKVKRAERKRLGKNVLPFDAASARASKRTLRDVVIAYCNDNEGTIPFSAIKTGLKDYAPKGMKIPPNGVGPILTDLGHQWCKPGNVVHYRIAGGASSRAHG